MWFTPSGGQRPDASSYVDKIAERPEDYRVLERLPLDEKSVPEKFKGAGEVGGHTRHRDHRIRA